MENYRENLLKQKHEIEELLKKSEKDLTKYKNVPKGKIKVAKKNGCDQYYYASEKESKYVYVRKTRIKDIERFVQRDYEVALNNRIRKMVKTITKFLNNYDFDVIDNVYMGFPEGKRKLIDPLDEPKEKFVARWKEEHKGGQNTFQNDGTIYTAGGECVRSKSEKIISDIFDKYNIPYSYEPRLVLKNERVVYPDFCILNVRLRKTIYWEHLGLIDDIEYASKNLKKIKEYEDSGYYLGDNLIVSMESNDGAFDSRSIEKKIIKYCL